MADTRLGDLVARLRLDGAQFSRELGRAERRLRRTGQQMEAVGQSLTTRVTLPIAAIGVAATRAATTFDTAMTGVAKTVDAPEAALRKLGEVFTILSDRIPVSANRLAELAEQAGQLGVAVREIPRFVRVVAELGVATNLSALEAGNALARLSNIMGTSFKDVRRLGSAIVDLGNNLATTEAEITEMALRISGAGKAVGLAEADVLGLAGALSSVGVRADAGGTAIRKAFSTINDALAEGTREAELFARVAGRSMDEFRRIFAEDAAEAFTLFVEGLRRIQDEGGNTFQVLKSLGLQEERLRDAVLRLAGAVGGEADLRGALLRANIAFEENTALTEEATRFFNRLGAVFELIANRAFNTARIFGDALRPAIESSTKFAITLLGVAREMTERFAALAPAVRRNVGLFIALGAALPPVILGLGVLANLAASAIAGFGKLRFVALPLTAAFAALLVVVNALGFRIADLAERKGFPALADAMRTMTLQVRILVQNIELAFTRIAQIVLETIDRILSEIRRIPAIGDELEKGLTGGIEIAIEALNARMAQIRTNIINLRIEMAKLGQAGQDMDPLQKALADLDAMLPQLEERIRKLVEGGSGDFEQLGNAAADVGTEVAGLFQGLAEQIERARLGDLEADLRQGVRLIERMGEQAGLSETQVASLIDQFTAMRTELESLRQTSDEVFVDLGRSIESATTQIATGFLRGTRDFENLFRDAMVGIFEDMLRQMLEAKLDFDLKFKKNFLGLGDFANKVFRAIADNASALFGAIGSGVKAGGSALGGVVSSLGGALLGVVGLQHGGVTTGPTLAMIGENGPEAVIPLDRLEASEPTVVVNVHSSQPMQARQRRGSGGGTVVDIDEMVSTAVQSGPKTGGALRSVFGLHRAGQRR